MIKFGKEKVLLLHRLLIEETGGEDGVRDIGLLESALEAPYAGFDGKDSSQARKKRRRGFAPGSFPTTLLWTEINASACM